MPTILPTKSDGDILTAQEYNILAGFANVFVDLTEEQVAWLPNRITSHIDVRDYGVTGDGVTDETTLINSIIAAAPNGATILFPGTTTGYKANIVVARPNIQLIFGGRSGTVGGTQTGTDGNCVRPADPNVAAFTIGNGGVTLVHNVRITGLNLLGTGNDAHVGHGLVFNGCRIIEFVDLNVESFGGNNIHMTSSGATVAGRTTYIQVANVRTAYSRQNCFYMEQGAQFVSAVTFSNAIMESGAGTNSLTITLKTGSELFLNNTWIQASNLKGLVLETDSQIRASNVVVDSASSTDILATVTGISVAPIYGTATIDGKIRFTDTGLDVPWTGAFIGRVTSRHRDPVVQGDLHFTPRDPASLAEYDPDGSWRILRSGTFLSLIAGGKSAVLNTAGQWRLDETGSAAGLRLGTDALLFHESANLMAIGSGDAMKFANMSSATRDTNFGAVPTASGIVIFNTTVSKLQCSVAGVGWSDLF